jgi:hypothetical protein
MADNNSEISCIKWVVYSSRLLEIEKQQPVFHDFFNTKYIQGKRGSHHINFWPELVSKIKQKFTGNGEGIYKIMA